MRKLAAVIGLGCILAACGAKQPPQDTQPPPETTEASPLIAACDAGTARSCLLAANDAETAGDVARAAKLYNAACALEDSAGCALAGGLFAEQGSLGDATTAFATGCQLNDATSCYGQALVLAGSFGGDPDFAAAVPLFQRGCELGLAAACGDLAGLYRAGQGVAVDLVKADALRTQACDGGDGESCMHLGLSAWQRNDRAAAQALFERSCANELPDPTGCGYFGWILWSDQENPDHARGIALMDAACEAASAVGCSLRAVTHVHTGDPESGKALLARACELDGENCEQFSAEYEAALKAK